MNSEGDSRETDLGGPLAGLRVLDLSRVLAGPYAAQILADLGARVVKVERPGAGDDTRSWGPPFVHTTDPESAVSTYFLSANRGKLSICLDLKSERDRPLLTRLLEWADVVVENFRPGVMDRLGLSDDRLAKVNPRLVRLSISGFGENGPDRDRVGYDQIVQAESGLMSLTGDPGGPPVKVGVPVADLTAGLFGVIGVLAALLERHSSGVGQRVTTSLMAGQLALHTFQATRFLIAGETPGPSGRHHPTVAPYGTFSAADGPLVIAVGNDEIWQRFAMLVGISPDEAEFATNADRFRNRTVLHERIEGALARRTVSEWVGLLSPAGIPCGAVRTLAEVYTSPQVRDTGMVWQVQHPSLGTLELPGSPLRFSGSPVRPGLAPPNLGEHTDDVRAWFTHEEEGDPSPWEVACEN